MDIPQTLPQVLFFVALVVPGIAFTTTRDAILGPRSASTVPSRILEALFISVIFDAVYLAFVGGFYRQISAHGFSFIKMHIPLVSVLGLVMTVLIPIVVAFRTYALAPALRLFAAGVRPFRLRTTTYVNVPSAWDFVANRFDEAQFVRVLLADGKWVGGLFSSGSFVSTFPQPHDIYIEEEWNMDAGGKFLSPLESRGGVWLPISGALLVEWLPVPSSEVAKDLSDDS